mmetsp:Transcript_13957/g.16092  ORF Transcript_13957/g.16092 Transcript_13957/m.16092 type:complete len:422 (-) Transcript_13957:176-1441(-)
MPHNLSVKLLVAIALCGALLVSADVFENTRAFFPKQMTVKDCIERIEGSLWGYFIADSLAMPAHWYYNKEDIVRDYGTIKHYLKPKRHHPEKFTTFPADEPVPDDKAIVGKVILKGKLQYWNQDPPMHVHALLDAGENTLDAQLLKLQLKTMIDARERVTVYDRESFLEEYVRFMTTEGSHDDLYAESFHRHFFVNYDKGINPHHCQSEETHDTASIYGLTWVPAAAFTSIIDFFKGKAVKEYSEGTIPEGIAAAAIRVAKMQMGILQRGTIMPRYAEIYAAVLLTTLVGVDVREAIDKIAAPELGIDFAELAKKDDDEVGGKLYKLTCEVPDSFPLSLFFVYKYADDIKAGFLANANMGGSNVGRAAVIGPLLGAQKKALSIEASMIRGLKDSKELHGLIDTFAGLVLSYHGRDKNAQEL